MEKRKKMAEVWLWDVESEHRQQGWRRSPCIQAQGQGRDKRCRSEQGELRHASQRGTSRTQSHIGRKSF